MNVAGGGRELRPVNPLLIFTVGLLVGALVVGASAHVWRDDDDASAIGAGAPGAVSTGVGDETVAVDGGGVMTGPTSDASSPSGADTASGGGTSSASAGASATPAAGGAAAGSCGGEDVPGTQGVTDKAIKIGFAIPDLGPFAAIANTGDAQAQLSSVIEAMRKEKRLPICGRDIQPVFRKFNVLDPSASRALCDAFADQDKVFMVVSLYAFSGGPCVTVEKKLPLLDAGQAFSERDFAASPLLFGHDPPIEVQLRAATYWAVRSGLLDGKSIGVYYNKNGSGGGAPPAAAVEEHLIKLLAKLGHPVKAVVASDCTECARGGTTDPNDAIAVQRFKADGIEVVFPYNFGTNFFQQAQTQGYHAQWLVYGSTMTTSNNPQMPAASFDGALGLSFVQGGEKHGSIPTEPHQERCMRHWTDAGNPRVEAYSPPGIVLREACDTMDVLLRAFTAVGRPLSHATFVAGMETVRDVRAAYYSNQTFQRGKHWGGTQNSQMRYRGDCGCFKREGWSSLFTGL